VIVAFRNPTKTLLIGSKKVFGRIFPGKFINIKMGLNCSKVGILATKFQIVESS